MRIALKKEQLLKYKFWILLAFEPILILMAIYILTTSVARAIDVRKKELDNKRVDADKAAKFPKKDYRNPAINKKLKEEASKFQKQESKVWENAYTYQEPVFIWPKEMEDKYHFSRSFESPTTLPTAGWFADEVRIETGKKVGEQTGEANVVRGEITERGQEYIWVKDSSKKLHKIYQSSEKTIKIHRAGDANPLVFNNLQVGDVVSVFYQEGKYFGDKFTRDEQELYDKCYRDQIVQIIEQVEPLDVKGDGVVQLGNWRYDKDKLPGKSSFLYYLDKPFNTEEDFSEEIWIAQEDLWIQNEIYSLIRKANDSISVFEGTGGDGDKDYTFTNPNWQITLRWKGGKEGNKLAATFRNLLPRQQRLDFKIRVLTDQTKAPTVIDLAKYQKKAFQPFGTEKSPDKNAAKEPDKASNKEPDKGKDQDGNKVQVEDKVTNKEEDRVPGKEEEKSTEKGPDTQDFEIVLPPTVSVKGVYRVEQVLTWETAAVRRIDGIYISQLGKGNPESNREFPRRLLAYGESEDAKPPPPAAGAGRMGFGAGAKVAVAIPGCPKTLTTDGFPRERYSLVKPKSTKLRRLPVAVVLIVEQGQLDRVQTAFNNSRMRFLTEQTQIRHYPSSLRPKAAQGSRNAKTSPSNAEMEANMELIIYGTMTIYERYPERRAVSLK